MVIEIVGTGTTEDSWLPFLHRQRWPALDLRGGPTPVVVAPHPDDEILGVSGVLVTAAHPVVVAVTDGEASHPDSTRVTRQELARVRRAETAEALRRLDRPDAAVIRLGQPDGAVDEEAVFQALTPHLAAGQWCFATWRGDGHPDHEAVGRAAARACAATGARLLEYPIWTWHWAHPDDPRVPWDRARFIRLSDDQLAAKKAAIAAFVSQVEPLGPDPRDATILPPSVVARFHRPYEVVFG